MKVTVLDDYQHAFQGLHAMERLHHKAEVQIFTEKFTSEAALIHALKGSQAIIPIRERTHFPAHLLKALPDLGIIAQTGNVDPRWWQPSSPEVPPQVAVEGAAGDTPPAVVTGWPQGLVGLHIG